MSQEEIHESWNRITIHKIKGRYSFTIEDFLGRMTSSKLLSPAFTIGEEQFEIEVQPNGKENGEHVSVLIQHVKHEIRRLPTVTVDFSVKKADGTPWGTVSKVFSIYDDISWKEIYAYSFETAFLKTSLLQKADELLPGGNLTIVCNIDLDLYRCVDETKVTEKSDTVVPNFGDNISAFCNNPALSDVTIICRDSSFYCHKVILTARSDVFATMFSHGDFSESHEHKVIVEDIESEVMKELLQFIYTDRCEVDEIALELLAAADKYNVIGLMKVCEEYLGSNIGFDNFDQVLLLSYLHKAKQLQKIVMDFMLKNLEEVKQTSGWKLINEKYPQIIAELITFITM